MRVMKAFYTDGAWRVGLLTEGGSVLVSEQMYETEREAIEALERYEDEEARQ
jgi:hypothetical protein